ncbi:MAG: MaoC family dehydratase N-terminal domain-containing protein [Candidatus Rokubacteria bacterium]|nr:MaoC family dehydratase N-terminal domain-containing protein [Candidatus Rokubacteria bacterium]
MAVDTVEAQIEEFIERSRALTGQEVREREAWNSAASRDAIRHFALGTSDGNPLWLDPSYAAKTQYGSALAPPGFLTSVLYPILHGAPMSAPLSSLIGGVEYRWFTPILEGDALRASTKQADLYEKKSGSGRRLIFIISEATYWNQRDEVVGKATGTMIRATQVGTELLFDRPIYRYSEVELAKIGAAIQGEARSGGRTPCWEDVQIGQEIPPIVRGPLTIGDMVCWQAAIGPSYRAGGLGYLDVLKAPHTAVRNPITGWPVKYSQQHEDFHLAAQRGMPGPFDNGVMRFAWVCPLITNWMGDAGFLKRLSVQVRTPAIYGDTAWYQGTVAEKARDAGGAVVRIRIAGVNQVGMTTTTGEADVVLPARTAGN